MRRFAVVAIVGIAAMAAAASLARSPATGDDDLAALKLTVVDAKQLSCERDDARWEIVARAVVQHLPGAVVEEAGFSAHQRGPGQTATAPAVAADVFMDGLAPGRALGRRSPAVFRPVLTVTLPCAADTAELVGYVTLRGSDRVLLARDPFLSSGVAMSSGSIGAAVAMALLGMAALAYAAMRRPERIRRRDAA